MKLSALKRADELLAQELRDDPEFRAEWERTALARLVAHRVLRFRAEHGLSQTELARRLGVKQPAVARLEAGEHNPGWETLARLANALGVEFAIEIAPAGEARTFIGRTSRATLDQSFLGPTGTRVRVLAT